MAHRKREVVDGVLAALAWVGGVVAVGPLVGGNPLVALTQAVIEAAPGAVATAAIERLGRSAQPLLLLAVSVTVVAALAAVDVAVRRRAPTGRERQAFLVGGIAATGAALYWTAGDASVAWVAATAFAVVPVGVLYWVRSWRRGAVGRREMLRETGSALGLLAGAGALSRTLSSGPGGTQPGAPLPAAEKEAGTTEPAGPDATTTDGVALDSVKQAGSVTVSIADSDADFGFNFEGMPRRVAGANAHYVVDKNFSAPTVGTDSWTLSVGGAVAEPYELDFSELVNHPDARSMAVTTVCISNPVGGGLISTARWRVVPLRDLLDAAGVEADAFDVVTRAVDGYTEALPWSVVREREDIAIAFGIDGQTLPRVHGFPARLLVPGRYGMKSTKWVDGIDVVTEDHESYWEARGWVEEAVVNTLSYIRAVQRRGDDIAVGGVAYAGRRGIERVEVSLDGGETWAEAELEAEISPHAWRRWRLTAERPDRGPLTAVVRAVDGTGEVQTEQESGPHPGGSTGWDSVETSL